MKNLFKLLLVSLAGLSMVSAQPPTTPPLSLSTTNGGGFVIESSSVVRSLFRSLKTKVFNNAWISSTARMRQIPIGDFDGVADIKDAFLGPFQADGLFTPVANVYEIWNVVDGDGTVASQTICQFMYAVLVTINPQLPTSYPRTQNITIHGTATLSNGVIQSLHLYMLNLYEAISLSGAVDQLIGSENDAIRTVACRKFKAPFLWIPGGVCWAKPFGSEVQCHVAYALGQLGSWSKVGKRDSLICKAWYQSFTSVSGRTKWCSVGADRCSLQYHDAQFPTVFRFYPFANAAAIPRVKAFNELPSFSTLVNNPPLTGSCDAACRSRLQTTIEILYSHTLWPTAGESITESGSFTELFTTVCEGRVTPAGTFTDALTNQEYFSGLTSSYQSRADKGFFLVNKATRNFQVITHVIIQLAEQPPSEYSPLAIPATNLSEMVVFQFNKEGRIAGYDASLSEVGSAYDTQSIADRAFNNPLLSWALQGITVPMGKNKQIEAICNTHVAACSNNPNVLASDKYASVADCTAFMNSIPFGTWDDIERHDTVTCRLLHTLLVSANPVQHCKHISRAGGGKCINKPLISWHDWQWLGGRNEIAAATGDPEGLPIESVETSGMDLTGVIIGVIVVAFVVLATIGLVIRRRNSQTKMGQNRPEPVMAKQAEAKQQSEAEVVDLSPKQQPTKRNSTLGNLKRDSNLSKVVVTPDRRLSNMSQV